MSDRLRAERDYWIRLFNRLEAAVVHHGRDVPPAWRSDADDALHAAHERVLRAAHAGVRGDSDEQTDSSSQSG